MPSGHAAAKVFKNCTELNKIYPGGVAMPGAINAGGTTKKNPNTTKPFITRTRSLIETKMG
jgi:hypothetical protein